MGPLLPGAEHVPPADEYRCVFGCSDRGGCDLTCANYVEYILEKEGDIAAVDPSNPGLPAVAATDSNDDTSRGDETETDDEAPNEDPPEGGATVVSLDSFRKKS